MDNEALYQERLALIERTINLEPVERLPVVYIAYAFSPRYLGVDLHRFCVEPDLAADTTIAAMQRLGGIDGTNGVPGGMIHIGLSTLWLSHVNIPGRELPGDSLWQVQEAEVMLPTEYDLIVDYGWQAFLERFYPRILDVAELQANLGWIMSGGFAVVMQKLRAAGIVPVAGGITSIPFEYLCGGRSMAKFFFDLYRMPDRVKAAMDVILPELIQGAIGGAQAVGVPRVWVGGWRAASGLVAPKLWDRFVWPYYYEMVTQLHAAGIVSILHWDQDWTRDLARLNELPPRSFILNPDGMTDVRRAKALIGDRAAIMGDVPASLFAAGTPDDIYNYVRDLVRDVGPTGLLLCPGCDAPINTKPENMQAFIAASHEFGRVAVPA
jgi:uroporphyrinogen-III decarboxylase